MWFGLITLFPESLAYLQWGVLGRAIKEGIITVTSCNPRDYTQNKHRTVDDKPFGGGPGMLMKPEPLAAAIEAACDAAPARPTVVYLSPQGKPFNQQAAHTFAAKCEPLLFISGRYEGIDERIIETYVDEEWSIGDYILTGGELPAMVMIETIARLIPGVLGEEDSVTEDSLTSGLLKYPQYTRPDVFAGKGVPDVLLSGHHEEIKNWRLAQSIKKTWSRRPDLIEKRELSLKEAAILKQLKS